MPKLTRVTANDASNARVFTVNSKIRDDDFHLVKDAWINKSGSLLYAGYYNHEESAKLLGFDSIESAESSGLVHISSCLNSKPKIVYTPQRMTAAQRDTLDYYCSVHSI